MIGYFILYMDLIFSKIVTPLPLLSGFNNIDSRFAQKNSSKKYLKKLS